MLAPVVFALKLVGTLSEGIPVLSIVLHDLDCLLLSQPHAVLNLLKVLLHVQVALIGVQVLLCVGTKLHVFRMLFCFGVFTLHALQFELQSNVQNARVLLRKRVLLVQLFQVVGHSEVVGHVHSLSFAAVSFISFNLNIVCFLALLEQVLFSDLLFLFETVLELFAHSSLSAVNKFEDFSDLVGNVGKYNEPAVRVVHLLDHISDFFA